MVFRDIFVIFDYEEENKGPRGNVTSLTETYKVANKTLTVTFKN